METRASTHRTRSAAVSTGVLLVATALLYTWGLDESGWANAYYSAAAQAGAASWKAFFFGSFDAANAITVDKTPLALWPMALSVRFFGLSSWSILVPQALFGVATVWLVVRIVRRTTSSQPIALLAGATLALTPVAALMFRFNNPDALLVLLMTAAAGATLRAIEESRRDEGRPLRWVVAGGALIGLAYLAKMLQAFLVLPAFALTYLLFALLPLRQRVLHLLAAAGAIVAAAGWWVVAVALWPTSERPFIGGSQHNSVLDLTLGYNGLGRLNGNEEGSIGSGHWGGVSLWRLFTPSNGGQAGWLLPAALVLLVAGIVLARRHTRRRPELLATLTLFGTWLVVTALVFSLMRGIFHAYYAVALAPALAVVVAIGGSLLWEQRRERITGAVLAVTVLGTGVWSFALLARSADHLPWLRWVVAACGLITCVALLLGTGNHPTWVRRSSPIALALSIFVGLAGPAAWSVATASLPHQGAVITAGPDGRGTGDYSGQALLDGGAGGGPGGAAGGGSGGTAGGAAGGGPGGAAGGGSGGASGAEPRHASAPGLPDLFGGWADTADRDGSAGAAAGTSGTSAGSFAGSSAGTPAAPSRRLLGPITADFAELAPAMGLDPHRPTYGPAGSLLYVSTPSEAVVELLRDVGPDTVWAAATVGANSAAGFQLASGLPVIAIGGFNGTDPAPTLVEFQRLVADGKVRWFIGGGLLGPQQGGSDAAGRISIWVSLHATPIVVDGVLLYDLAPLARP